MNSCVDPCLPTHWREKCANRPKGSVHKSDTAWQQRPGKERLPSHVQPRNPQAKQRVSLPSNIRSTVIRDHFFLPEIEVVPERGWVDKPEVKGSHL
jgi:hypothetical protein